MAVTSDRGTGPAEGNRFGFRTGQVVQELGYDDDVDFDVREEIEEAIGAELADEDYGDVTDGAVIWWRDDDGDLVDALVDAQTLLDDGGLIWVLTPKAGRDGHIGPGEIEEAATTAGLHTTSSVALGADWSGTRLGARGRGK